MSQSPDPKRDELADRLVDQALREVLGGEAPPDLSDQILAAAEKQGFVSPQHKEKVMDKWRRGYRLWALCAVAACLVVGIGILVVSTRPPQLALETGAPPTGEGKDVGDRPSVEVRDHAASDDAEAGSHARSPSVKCRVLLRPGL